MRVIARRAEDSHKWHGPYVPALDARPFEVPDAHAERVLLPQRHYIRVPTWYVRDVLDAHPLHIIGREST